MNISVLVGCTLTSVQPTAEELVFTTTDGRAFKLFHDQECCETVEIEDIAGALDDLIGAPILQAEEATRAANDYNNGTSDDKSHTWTFYKFATVKGYVTVRWYGSSNGYYSESVDFDQVQ